MGILKLSALPIFWAMPLIFVGGCVCDARAGYFEGVVTWPGCQSSRQWLDFFFWFLNVGHFKIFRHSNVILCLLFLFDRIKFQCAHQRRTFMINKCGFATFCFLTAAAWPSFILPDLFASNPLFMIVGGSWITFRTPCACVTIRHSWWGGLSIKGLSNKGERSKEKKCEHRHNYFTQPRESHTHPNKF